MLGTHFEGGVRLTGHTLRTIKADGVLAPQRGKSRDKEVGRVRRGKSRDKEVGRVRRSQRALGTRTYWTRRTTRQASNNRRLTGGVQRVAASNKSMPGRLLYLGFPFLLGRVFAYWGQRSWQRDT